MTDEEKCPACGEPLKRFSGKRFIKGKWVLNEFENSCKNCKWNADETRHWNKEFEVDENTDEDEIDFVKNGKV